MKILRKKSQGWKTRISGAQMSARAPANSWTLGQIAYIFLKSTRRENIT